MTLHALDRLPSLPGDFMQPYLAYAGWNGDFRHGDDDDSLSFGGVSDGPPADAEVVWLDFGRYGLRHDPAGLARWSRNRLSDAACVLLARELACRWLPASLRSRIAA